MYLNVDYMIAVSQKPRGAAHWMSGILTIGSFRKVLMIPWDSFERINHSTSWNS